MRTLKLALLGIVTTLFLSGCVAYPGYYSYDSGYGYYPGVVAPNVAVAPAPPVYTPGPAVIIQPWVDYGLHYYYHPWYQRGWHHWHRR